ncbi:MAG: acetate--CoA ligase family protein [Nocardioidaceae bacterium]
MRDLTPLFDPRSVAVVGASDDQRKYGNWLARRLAAGTRPLHLINARADTVLGRPSAPSLQSLDTQVDLAVLATPASTFDEAVEDALAAGVRALVGITSGLGELGGTDLHRQRALARRVRSCGALLLGPNCLGLLDHTSGLEACIEEFPSGSVALISQSGNIALEVARRMAECGLGISRFVSVGNQADVNVVELLEACSAHEGTDAVAIYCEGFGDGRAFAQAAATAVRNGKPVVLLSVGSSTASARGAASHTGALVSPDRVVQAACHAAGVDVVSSPTELVEVLQAVTWRPRISGNRVAVLADGGGHGSVAGDLLDANGLQVPVLSQDLQQRLGERLPAQAGLSNPIDVAGAGERDLHSFDRITRLLMASNEVDAVLLTGYFGSYHTYGAELAAEEVAVAERLGRAARDPGSCLVAHVLEQDSRAATVLREHHVPCYTSIEAAARSLARLVRHPSHTPCVPSTAHPAPPVVETGYWPSRRLLSAGGVRFVEAAEVSSSAQLRAAAQRLGFPLALKALGSEHKSDDGGVLLGLDRLEELEAAWSQLQHRLRPPSCSVEQMAELTDSVELIVGARTDPSFGTVLMVGMGGIFAELVDDTCCALGPVSEEDALAMVNSLRASRVLHGVRGRRPVDVEAAAQLIHRLSEVAARHPEIRELECNPVAVTPNGAVALDSRMVLFEES